MAYAYKSPEELLKILGSTLEGLIARVWSGTGESAFLACSQVIHSEKLVNFIQNITSKFSEDFRKTDHAI